VEEKHPIKIFVAVQATHDASTTEKDTRERKSGGEKDGDRDIPPSPATLTKESEFLTYGRMRVFSKRGFRASFT
jgi:hypothetical protein